MPTFEYKGFNNKGKQVRGIIDADDPQTARTKLHQRGIHPTELIKSSGGISASEPLAIAPEIQLSRILRRTKPGDIAILTRQLATLLAAGLPLTEALSGLIEQLQDRFLKKTIIDVREMVRNGSTLSAALSKHPKVFSSFYTNMVRAGENAGALEIVLERLADYTEKQMNLRNKVRAGLYYPGAVALAAGGVLLFLFIFVIPKVTHIFEEVQQSLPPPTIVLIAISNFLKNFWWLLGVAILGLFLVIRAWLRTEPGRLIYDRIKLKMPLFGGLSQKTAVARFARTLATLLIGGIPLLDSLNIVKNIVGNKVLSKAIDSTAGRIRQGESMADPLRRSGVFPPIVVRMIAAGEKSGKLEDMLSRVATAYDQEVETRVTALTAFLEPLMILAMGLVVGFIVLAILLPIFEMSRVIR